MSMAEFDDAPSPMLSFALDYVRRGWPVFPCNPLNKHPFLKCDVDAAGAEIQGTGGLKKASLDPAQVKDWWQKWPNAMIGVPMGQSSGVWAIDPDAPKKDAQPDGRKHWAELKLKHGNHAPTHAHNTPNQGQHILFKWRPDKAVGNREGALKRTGINVRGEGGYLIVPPSMVADGRRYEFSESLDIFKFAEAPDWLYELIFAKPSISEQALELVRPPARLQGTAHAEYADAALHNEADNVATAPPGGRNNALNTAAFSLGTLVAAGELSQGQVVDALLNAAGSCGLIHEDGQRGVMQTINSGLKAGMQHPRDIPERDSPPIFSSWQGGKQPGTAVGDGSAGGEQKPARITAAPYKRVDPASIPLRDWLYGFLLVRQFVTATVSPGGVGKSSLIAVEALAMASGKPLLGITPRKRLKVWLWNLEDPQIETQRKIEAAALHYGLTPEDTDGYLFVNSGRDTPLVTATTTRNGAMIIRPVIDNLVEELIANEIDVLKIDPFVSSHAVPENDNTFQDMIVKEWGRVADRAKCAIELVDHTRKATNGDSEVTTESSRGAKAKTDACRVVRVVNRMSEQEADRAGVENHRLYFRCYNDKSNLAPPADTSEWFKLEGVDLGNGPLNGPGDSVGVVTCWSWPQALDGVTGRNVEAVFDKIRTGRWRESHQARDWVGLAVSQVMNIDYSTKTGKARIREMVKAWIASGALVIVDGKDEKGVTRPYIEVSEAAR